MNSLPVSGSGITISDSAGYMWAESADFSGKYVGLKTHRGTIALSYVPFKGAREMGRVEGKDMVLHVDKNFRINVKSETAFLPADVVAKVYAIYRPEKRSKGVNSVHTWGSNKEERILSALDK